MAKFLNPLTGQMEDDGVPAPAVNAVPVAPAPAAEASVSPAPVESPAPMVAPVPVMATTDTTSATSVSRQIATPEEKRLQSEREKLVEKDMEIAAKAAELGRQKAIEDEAQAAEKFRLTNEKQARVDEITTKGQIDLATKQAEADSQYALLKEKANIKDYWADAKTGDKVLAGIAIALGGLGAGLAGGENRALGIINRAVEQDFERQKANFLNQRGVLEEARRGSTEARQTIADQLNLLNISKQAAYESLADKYAASAAKRGVPAAELEKDKVLNGLRSEAIKARQEFERSLRSSVQTSTQTQVNQELAKPAGMSEEVKKAQDEFQGNEDFKSWKGKRQALDSFKSLRAGGADGAAVADFIATGLKQGSFGPEMVNILQKKNLINKAGEFVRENVVGGFDPKLLQSLENGLIATEARARQRAKPVIERSKAVARANKLPEDYFAGAEEAPEQTKQPSLSPEDKAALDWANANPSDPRAAQIKRSLGQ